MVLRKPNLQAAAWWCHLYFRPKAMPNADITTKNHGIVKRPIHKLRYTLTRALIICHTQHSDSDACDVYIAGIGLYSNVFIKPAYYRYGVRPLIKSTISTANLASLSRCLAYRRNLLLLLCGEFNGMKIEYYYSVRRVSVCVLCRH